jgi:hypothetical protein
MSEHHTAEHRDPMRLAYYITSYGDGAQLLHLVRTLRAGDPGAEIVVQHDETHHPVVREPLEELGVHVLLSPERIGWGDITLERARWRAFEWILDELDVDWVMLLSEQDHPTSPLGVFHEQLGAAGAAGTNAIMVSWPIDEVPEAELRAELDQRYRFRWYALPGLGLLERLPRPVAAATERFLGGLSHRLLVLRSPVRLAPPMPTVGVPTRIGFRAVRTPFTRDEPCWFNSCWFALDRRAMRSVVDRVRNDPDFARYFERTLIPVESVTPTILGNDPSIHVEHVSTHTINWSDHRSGRPDVFTIEDVPMLLAAPQPFARKFSSDPLVLDAVDEHVLITQEETS